MLPGVNTLKSLLGRRRLLDVSGDCSYNTDKSITVDRSSSYSVEMSTSGDPAIIDGDGDMFLMAIMAIFLQQSSVLNAILPSTTVTGPATAAYYDVFPAQLESSACNIRRPYMTSTASMDPGNQLVWVSQWQIKNQILPLSSQASDGLLKQFGSRSSMDAANQAAFDLIQQNADNWNGILQWNNQLKATAMSWPELMKNMVVKNPQTRGDKALSDDLTTSAYLDNNDVVVSFGGDMGDLSFEVDIGAGQDISNDVGLDLSTETGGSLSGGVTVVGVGLQWSLGFSLSNSSQYKTLATLYRGSPSSYGLPNTYVLSNML